MSEAHGLSRGSSHSYARAGTYEIAVTAAGKRVGTHQLVISPTPTAWQPPAGWVQPAGWATLGGGATYLPCSTIEWFWDPTGQPANASAMRGLMPETLARISKATGLNFVETTDRSKAELLIDWKWPNGQPTEAAGLGGGGWNRNYGEVNLNPNNWWVDDQWSGFGPITRPYVSPDGRTGTQSSTGNGVLLLHEIGHALGLGHVDDTSEIMNPVAGAVSDFGVGDLNGLWTMYASQPCPA